MFKGRSIIRGVALVTLAALVVLWLLPPEHLHPALEGRSVVVHRHAISATAPQAASSVDHGDHSDHGDHGHHDDHSDHSDAQILKTVFESAPRFAPDSPVVKHATSVIASSWRVVGYIALLYEWTCHDPPDRPTSLRAPPA